MEVGIGEIDSFEDEYIVEDCELWVVGVAEEVLRRVSVGVGVDPAATRVMILLGSIRVSCLITNRALLFSKTSFTLGDPCILDGILTRRRGMTYALVEKKSVSKQKRRAWSCMSSRERAYRKIRAQPSSKNIKKGLSPGKGKTQNIMYI